MRLLGKTNNSLFNAFSCLDALAVIMLYLSHLSYKVSLLNYAPACFSACKNKFYMGLQYKYIILTL